MSPPDTHTHTRALTVLRFYIRYLCGIKTDPNYYDAIHSPDGGASLDDSERNPLLEVQRSAGGLNSGGGTGMRL